MSESNSHTALVNATVDAILREYQGASVAVLADVSRTREYAPTFAIGGYRPDAYVRVLDDGAVTIGEAKTASDIDNLHTRAQLKEFFEHLATTRLGVLWMSVPLIRAGEALRVLRSARQTAKAAAVRIVVSGWLLGQQRHEQRWRV